MKFLVQKSLNQRSATEQENDEPVDGSLLVGENHILDFVDNESEYGHDSCLLYPAFHNGTKCWLLYCNWSASGNYCASGSQEEILDYQTGVNILVDEEFFSSHHEKE